MSASHYYATACGHKHGTPEAAAQCPQRGFDQERLGPRPVIEVTIRPGMITRTRELPEPEEARVSCCEGCKSLTVNDRRAQLDSQITEPVTEGLTPAEQRADLERWLDDCQAQSERLDEEHLLLGIGRSAAIYMTHEITGSWATATADRWFRALPERYMTPDSMARPDWNHSHYPHDEHGHIGRVTTRQRPKTQADTDAEQLVTAILTDLDSEEN